VGVGGGGPVDLSVVDRVVAAFTACQSLSSPAVSASGRDVEFF
jgi:hypothetical protein